MLSCEENSSHNKRTCYLTGLLFETVMPHGLLQLKGHIVSEMKCTVYSQYCLM